MPRANVVRGTRRRPHFSKVSSPDVSAAAVEPRGLQNLKQTSTENQNEEQDSEKRWEILHLGTRVKQGRSPDKYFLTFSLLNQTRTSFS